MLTVDALLLDGEISVLLILPFSPFERRGLEGGMAHEKLTQSVNAVAQMPFESYRRCKLIFGDSVKMVVHHETFTDRVERMQMMKVFNTHHIRIRRKDPRLARLDGELRIFTHTNYVLDGNWEDADVVGEPVPGHINLGAWSESVDVCMVRKIVSYGAIDIEIYCRNIKHIPHGYKKKC